jgi:hypothetical protein
MRMIYTDSDMSEKGIKLQADPAHPPAVQGRGSAGAQDEAARERVDSQTKKSK